MIEINFYKALCGDAIKISFISENRYHHIFIDSGFERTYRDILRDEIELITSKKETIDLWTLTHIHDDHVGGAIGYINAIKLGKAKDIVETWLYNHPRSHSSTNTNSTPKVSEAKSISQGDKISAYLSSISKLANSEVTSSSPPINIDRLKITILSPNQEKLEQLKGKYRYPNKHLEMSELNVISEAKGRCRLDFSNTVNSLSLLNCQEDQNIENGSCIAQLVEIDDVRALFLADAHPSTVLESLKSLGYSKAAPLKCDLVKVSHHGSSGNNSRELYEVISCSNYVLSVNGNNKHCLPSKQCVVSILTNPARNIHDKYTFYFTSDDSVLKSMFSVDDENIFSRLNFEMKYLSNAKRIKFTFAAKN